MNKIFRIARLELCTLFYSPIAWLLLILFLVQTGITFFTKLDGFDINMQMGYPLKYITFDIFSSQKGIFTGVQNNLYLYIPLLTMGLISRERSSGSIKLLFSSPVNVRQIVLGKFFAMVAYCFILMFILFAFLTVGALSIESAEISVLFGGIFGLFLLACAYSAIGLFMSCLTSYQVVAAISTLAVLAFLNFVGEIGQGIDLVRDITYWISISGRCENFIGGLISSKDIIYFLIVISLFLVLSMMKLSAGRQIRTVVAKILRYSVLVLGAVMLGYFSSLPIFTAYWDTTRNLRRTLTKNSQEIVKKIDKPLKITTYVNMLDYNATYGMPKKKIKDIKAFEQFQRFLPNMDIEYVYYYNTPVNRYWLDRYPDKPLKYFAKKTCVANRFDLDRCLTPEEIAKRVDLSKEENRFVRTVEYDGKTAYLRMFDDMMKYPGEAEISAVLKNLTGFYPKVGFLVGHKERSKDKTGDKDYKVISNSFPVRGSLINQGFLVENIDIRQEIPAHITVLVLADPKSKFTDEDIQKIEKYIDKGGNLLIAGEPGKQSLLNPIVKKLGIEFADGTILQQSKNFDLDLVAAKFTKDAARVGFGFGKKINITMPGVSSIKYEKNGMFDITPILVSNKEKCWNRLGEIDLDSGNEKFNPDTDKKVALPLAVSLTRRLSDKYQKIMVLGDADFMSNSELNRYNIRNKNSAFAMTMFKWFSDGEFPISIRRDKPLDTKLLIGRSGIAYLRIGFIAILPLILGIMGGITLIRRKRN